MKLSIKTLSSTAFAVLMLAGCILEQESQAKAAAEKGHQEEIAAKERETRQKAIDEVNNSTNGFFIVDTMKNGQDDELRELAKSRLRDITLREIAVSTNVAQLTVLSSSDAYELFRESIISNAEQEKALCEKAFDGIWGRILDSITYPSGNLRRDMWQDEYMRLKETKAWNYMPSDVQKDIYAAFEKFFEDVDAIENKYLRKQMYDSDATAWRNQRISKCISALRALGVQFKQQTLDSVIRNGKFSKMLGNLEVITARYEMQDVRTAAKRRIEELRKANEPVKIEKYYQNLAEHNYNLLLNVLNSNEQEWKIYERYGEYIDKIKNARARNYKETKPWQRLVDSRLPISEKENQEGQSKIEEFGTRFMPGAYANYDRARESAREMQQMFNEEFPEPYKVTRSRPEWNAYTNLLHGLMNVRTQYLRRHDELCHFYLMHKVGAVSADELSVIDSHKISIRLYEEDPGRFCLDTSKDGQSNPAIIDESLRAFAEKYTPESYSIYKTCENEFAETQRLEREILADVRIMDITRFELSVVACYEKIVYLTRAIDNLAADFKTWHIEHKTMLKDATSIAELDRAQAVKWKDFVELLPGYLRLRANGPLIAANSPMNKYNSCNIVRDWHWSAIGIFQPDEISRERFEDHRMQIGDKIDQPTFITGMSKQIFIGEPNVYYDHHELARCRKFVDSDIIYFSNIREKDGSLSDTAFSKRMSEIETIGRISIYKDDATGVANGFPDDSVFVSRLNEIDFGKAVYYGLKLVGRNRRGEQVLSIQAK